jgi:hypothetical protein
VGSRRGLQFGLQVLDGPPGVAIRRLSTFLLIPVGQHRRGFAFYGLQEQLCRIKVLYAMGISLVAQPKAAAEAA